MERKPIQHFAYFCLKKGVVVVSVFLLVSCGVNSDSLNDDVDVLDRTESDCGGDANCGVEGTDNSDNGEKTGEETETEEVETEPPTVEKKKDDDVFFIAFGDWGTGGDNQKAVAKAMGSYCDVNECEFVLTLGDNIYPNGVESTTDSQWQTKYRDIYTDLELPFYALLGNHDVRGNEQAEIDYSSVDSSWHMPAEYYSFVSGERGDTGDPMLEIFGFNSQNFGTSEAKWLSSAISASRARWKIVAMHFPIYGNRQNADDVGKINNALIPVICDKIDIVLSGHEHQFVYMRDDSSGCLLDQVTLGIGGASLDTERSDPRLIANGYFHGFGWFEAAESQLTLKVIKADNTTFYTTSWEK